MQVHLGLARGSYFVRAQLLLLLLLQLQLQLQLQLLLLLLLFLLLARALAGACLVSSERGMRQRANNTNLPPNKQNINNTYYINSLITNYQA